MFFIGVTVYCVHFPLSLNRILVLHGSFYLHEIFMYTVLTLLNAQGVLHFTEVGEGRYLEPEEKLISHCQNTSNKK